MEKFQNIIFIALAFMWIVLGSTHIAKFFQKIKLPLITGFLFAGILAGPFVLKLVSSKSLSELHFIHEFSLAYIAFAAGSELYLKEIKSNLKSIAWNTFGQLVVTFLVGAFFVYYLSDYIPFMQSLSDNSRIAIAILSGTIFVARSPSSIIAVINELRAKGPFTKTAVGVTVVKDILVIILFAICLSISNTLVKGSEFTFMFIVELMIELLVAFGGGYLLSELIKRIYATRLSSYFKISLLLISGYLVYPLAHALQHYTENNHGFSFLVEPLLVCIIASFLMVNNSRFRIEFQKHLEEIGPIVFAVFFTLVGATMSLDVLIKVWGIALVFWAIRMLGLILGAYVGSTLAGDPKLFRRIGWMPYVTQAGVGLAFALIIANSFPEWGERLATIIIGVIIINQLIGAVLFKWAVRRVGESHEQLKGHHEHNTKALIFGYENQSVALSQELIKHGWDIKMLTSMKAEKVDPPDEIEMIFLDRLSRMKEGMLDDLKLDSFETFVLMLSDEYNYLINEYIYEHVGKRTVIVRLHERSYLNDFHALGSLVIDPSMAMVNLLQHFVRSPQATSLLLGMEPNKDTIDIEILDQAYHGMALRNLRLPSEVLILSVKRKGQVLISHGYTRLRLDDIITLVGPPDLLEQLQVKFG